MRRLTHAVLIAVVASMAVAASAAEAKFRPAPGPEPVVGRYLVTLDASIGADLAGASAEALARAYSGQLEPYASSDARQFAIAMLPARARGLSADPRVHEVVEIAHPDSALTPTPPAASARLAGHLTPVTRDISSSGDYLYDGSGNIKSIGSDSFAYDVDGRLMQATVQGNQQSYNYDAFGNRLSATRAANAAGCVGGCEAAVTVRAQNNHLVEQTYDDAGNVLSGFGASYTYDGTGMVTRATVGTDDRIFLYTAGDERIAVRNGTSWTWTVRDQGNKVLREFTSAETSPSPLVLTAHTWTKDYIWRDGLLLASVSQGSSGLTTYHYHLDHLGTPRMITNDAGILVAKHTYYPFGAEINITPHESAVEAMKFTGHERDTVAGNNTSVDYMHARYYNASLGRFLSIDPSLGTTNDPQSWNRYSYVKNNPLLLSDPDGRDSRLASLFRTFGTVIDHVTAAAVALKQVPVVRGQVRLGGVGGTIHVGPLDVNLRADARIKVDAHGEAKLTGGAQATAEVAGHGSIGPQLQASVSLVRNQQALPDGLAPTVQGAAVYRGPDNGAKVGSDQVTATANLAFLALEVGVNYGQFANVVKEFGEAARQLVAGEGMTVKRDIETENRQGPP